MRMSDVSEHLIIPPGFKLLLVPEEDIVAYKSGDHSRAYLFLFQDEPYQVVELEGDVE